MSIIFEARAARSKLWPFRESRLGGKLVERGLGFIEGYVAGASRPVTDAEVEAACDGFYTHGIATWSGLVNGDPELADRYREWMREALEAARGLADKETP